MRPAKGYGLPSLNLKVEEEEGWLIIDSFIHGTTVTH